MSFPQLTLLDQKGVLQVNLRKNPTLLDNRSCSGEGRNWEWSFIQSARMFTGWLDCHAYAPTAAISALNFCLQRFSGKGNIICFNHLHQIFKSTWMVLVEAEGSTVFPHSSQSADEALFGTGRSVRSSVSSASSTSTDIHERSICP